VLSEEAAKGKEFLSLIKTEEEKIRESKKQGSSWKYDGPLQQPITHWLTRPSKQQARLPSNSIA
jgi:hypothetical protein